MQRRHFLCFTAIATLAISSSIGMAAEKAAKPYRMLMVTQSAGFRHGPVKRDGPKLSVSEVAMKQLAQQTGLFTVDCTQNVQADFTKENLQNYDLVMFYTTGELPIAPEDRDYFINDWLKQKGNGFIGVHSATDTYRGSPDNPKQNADYQWYWEMAGGSFRGHPWNANNTVTLSIHDTDHPTMKPFGGNSFVHTDEIYEYNNWQPEKVRVLMSLDMSKCEPKRPYHVPVAWVKSWGNGKVYINNLGHREQTWANDVFRESLHQGFRWIVGLEEGSSEVNPEVSSEQEELARQAVADAK